MGSKKKGAAKSKSKKRRKNNNTALFSPTLVYQTTTNQVEVMLTGLPAPIRGYIVRPLPASHLLLALLQTEHTKAARPTRSAQGAANTNTSSTVELKVSRIIALPSSAVASLTEAIHKRRRINVQRQRTMNNEVQRQPELLSVPGRGQWEIFELPDLKDTSIYTYTNFTELKYSEKVVTMGYPLNNVTVNEAMAKFLHTDCMYRVVEEQRNGKTAVRNIEFILRSRSVVKSTPPQTVESSLFHLPHFTGKRTSSTSIDDTDLTDAAMFGVQEPWIRVKTKKDFLRLLQTATNNTGTTSTSFECKFRDALSQYFHIPMTPRVNKSMRIVVSNCQKKNLHRIPDWSALSKCRCGLNGITTRCVTLRKQQQQTRTKKKKTSKAVSISTSLPKHVKLSSTQASLAPPTCDLMTASDTEHASQLHSLLLPYFGNVGLIAKGHSSSAFTKNDVIDCTVLPDTGVPWTNDKNRETVLRQLHSLVLAAEKKFQEKVSRSLDWTLGAVWIGCKSAHNRSYLVFLLVMQKIARDSSVGALSYSNARHFADQYTFERDTDALSIFKLLATEAKHRELWGDYVEWEMLDKFVNL